MDLNLQIAPRGADSLIASYNCPCGCNPRVPYARGAEAQVDDCCCGNQFAVGPGAAATFASASARRETVAFDAPWGGSLEAAWKLVMTGEADHDHGHDHDHDHHHEDASSHTNGHGQGDAAAPATTATDPVCGMTVDIVTATARDLVTEYEGRTFYFCGRGCKLEFGDDPGKYLDQSYVPSM
jgi:YHS domain-containing protein